MTPEERFERIEHNLERMGERLDRHIDFVGRSLGEQNKQIEKNTAGIRDLIVVSRTVLTSIEELREADREMRETHQKSYKEWTQWVSKWTAEWTAKMNELREAQAATDEKLNVLVDTVERIIRKRNDNKGQS
jgi:esterase/lipase